MIEFAGSLLVEDGDGARFQLVELRGTSFFLFRKIRKFMLDNGEPVKRIDFDNYVVARTGQQLRRIGFTGSSDRQVGISLF